MINDNYEDEFEMTKADLKMVSETILIESIPVEKINETIIEEPKKNHTIKIVVVLIILAVILGFSLDKIIDALK